MSKNSRSVTRIVLGVLVFASAATAQTGSTISLNFTFTGSATSGSKSVISLTATGTLAPYGTSTLNATLSADSDQSGTIAFSFVLPNGTLTATSNITKAQLVLIGKDSFSLSSSAAITGGTGAFAGSTGKFNYTMVGSGGTTIAVGSLTGSGAITFAQVFPHVAADTTWQTDFLILNTSNAAVSYTLVFHPDSGSAIPIAGVGAVSQVSGTVPVNGTAFYTSAATADSDGWAELDSPAPLTGVAVFRETSDQTSVLLGAPATSFTVPFDSTAPPNAPSTPYVDGLAIANTDPTNPASITCSAYDSNGTPLGGLLSGLSVPAAAHTAFLLQSTPPFTALPANTRGQLVCKSTTTVSAVELRALGDQVSIMPVITAAPVATTQLFPHVAADTSWQTDFVILNTSNAPISFTLTLHPDSGTAIPMAGMGAASQITGTIAANGTAFYTTDATADSDGWAQLTSSAPLSGVAVFRETNDQTSVLLNTASTSFVVSFDSTSPPNSQTPYVDGLAIANPSSTAAASISCQAYDSNGNALGAALTGTSVPALGHVAFVLQNTAPFTSLPANSRGQLVCTSTTAVAAVELRGLGQQISTLPVVSQ